MTGVVLTGCADDPENAADPDRADPADAAVDRFLDDILPKGASGTLVAARGRDMAHCQGFGMVDHEANVAATCDTVYDVMSMTKQFTAAAILKLEMTGRLETSDAISNYVGPVPADKREVTLHQLLTHTSGLIDALGDDYDRLTREEMLAAALKSELRSRPGTEYHYSNVGYSVLAAIVEKVSGIGYEEFLARHLFGPAGMTQTGYVLPEWDPDQVAVEYDPRGESRGKPSQHPWADDGPYWNLRGNGGLLSTARDMFRWHLALQGDEILDQRAKEKLFEPYAREGPGADTYYGYGWVIMRSDGGTVAWHNGGNGWSYGEVARLLDEGVLVFWITNRYADAAADWSLEQLGPRLTQGVASRVVAGA
ncbi:MAG TPA: serine hydrolase domain-containing protein [Solirubrobacterales bacterium]|nr:serine hydrolase domain-containing protein [Solirubrobacterales bacterium]